MRSLSLVDHDIIISDEFLLIEIKISKFIIMKIIIINDRFTSDLITDITIND